MAGRHIRQELAAAKVAEAAAQVEVLIQLIPGLDNEQLTTASRRCGRKR